MDPELYAYDGLQDKLFMVTNPVSWVQLNPMEEGLAPRPHILMLTSSGQRLVKGSVNKHNQPDVGRTPKNNISYQESTTRLPKGSNPYGNGGLILGRWARMLASTKVTQFSRSFMVCAGNGETLEMKLEITDGKVTNLYKLICRKELLIKARENLRGSMQSKDGLTDGLNHLLIEEIIQELESEKFKFSDVKLVYKAKANGKTRPQGIPTAKDKIIQEAMRVLLEVIYEGKFSDLSHGFRPGRSCHTALKQVSK